MKKGILVSCLALVVLTLTGCGDDSVKTMKCSSHLNQNGIKTESKYEVTYKGKYVETVKTVETMETDKDSADALEEVKKGIEALYADYAKLDHYDNEVKIEENVLTSTTNIDYTKVDTDAMIKINSAMGQIIKDGKVSIDDMKSLYEAAGATCEK